MAASAEEDLDSHATIDMASGINFYYDVSVGFAFESPKPTYPKQRAMKVISVIKEHRYS